MGILKCCVGGCSATSETNRLFCFPMNDNLRNLWMSFLVPTNPLLILLSKGQLLKKRVCDKHFDKQQFDGEGRRIRYSYPSLFSELEIVRGEPLTTKEWNVLNEHNYFQEQSEDDIPDTFLSIEKAVDDSLEQPSCSYSQINEDKVLNEHNYFQIQSENNTMESSSEIHRAAVIVHEQPSCSFTIAEEKTTPISVAGKKAVFVHEQPSCSFTIGEEKTTPISVAGKKVMKHSSCKTRIFPSKKRRLLKQVSTIADKILAQSNIQKLQQAKNSVKDSIIENFNALPKQARTFILMQLKHVKKNKMARRFTLDEKLVALTLMKQSPKGYKLLEKMFTLPSKRTLSRISGNIKFDPGLNPGIFEHIKRTVKNWKTPKKLCSILYDEVALTPHITFEEHKDEIVGFVDIAGNRKFKYCDHALVFMVRGICASWRQCIAYYFVEGTISASELQVILKDVVIEVSQTGLIPLGLVSDQGSTFRTAVRNLRQETMRSRSIEGLTDDGTVHIAGHNLNIFFDPPHLLKGLRNNFLTKDILFEGKIASWKDIQYIYDVDSKLGHTRALPKLTAHHVDPVKIKKMKVSVAAQVLSARTAAMLKYTNAICKSTNASMATTAKVVEFFDKLFDSVNGYPKGAKKGKLRKAVKPDSPHVPFWMESIKKLKAIQFKDSFSKIAIQRGQPRYVRVPSLEGWITSLESFIRISKLLFEKYNIDFYYPRYLNQDPIENFFGRLRALNYRNVNPDANIFMSSFKSLILSNILSPHSRFSNCEEDQGETLIDINYMFSNKEKDDDKENISPNTTLIYADVTSSSCDLADQVIHEKIRVHCSAYTAGYICRNISKIIDCKECLKTYTSSDMENIHMYISFREYKTLKNNNLAYPNEAFLRLYRDAAQYIHDYLNSFCYQRHVGKNIKKYFSEKMMFSWLGCKHHKENIKTVFLKIVIRLQVHNWCNIINKILRGAIEEKYVLRMNEPQKLALKKYKTLRLRKKKLTK